MPVIISVHPDPIIPRSNNQGGNLSLNKKVPIDTITNVKAIIRIGRAKFNILKNPNSCCRYDPIRHKQKQGLPMC